MSLFSGLSRPLKAAGLALVGIAVIAAVIGGITLATNGEDSDTATPGPTPTTSDGAVPPQSPAPSSPAPGSPPASSAPPSSAPASSAPPSSQPGQPGQTGQPGQPGQPGGDQQASHKWVTLRVYNNSTIHGLAARAADDFRASGWNVADVSNYSSGVIPVTTAYFRPGTDEEAAAKALAIEFGFRAEPRFEGIQNAEPGVIVIVTNNYKTNGKTGS